MGEIRYGEWGSWIAPMGVLLCLFAVITAQPGFLSISCGGITNYTDAENNITWVTDADYINAGKTADIGDASFSGSYLHTLRFFPKPLNKSCYQLPVAPDVTYLLRPWFVVGNYTGFQQFPSFVFSIETEGMLDMINVTTTDQYPFYYERIFVTTGRVLCLCLIRTSEPHDPFISAIELRSLQDGMYGHPKPGIILKSSGRYTFGGNSTMRFPQDKFDRIWITDHGDAYDDVLAISSQEPISTDNTRDFPPATVMQTAWVVSSWFRELRSFAQGTKSLLVLYFAEIEKLNTSETRSFYVTINGVTRSETITMVQNYSAIELAFLSNTTDVEFNLVKTPDSTLAPIINAYEYYILADTQQATYLQDIEALDGIKRSFNISDWISDPCYLIHWEGISCDSSSSPIRISEIDLSGRNLTGSVPTDIAQLTALVNVSLNNNDLRGPMPNLSNLAMLERLYLQNNLLSGSLPDWLSELKNLKELYIDNNNFSGEIPVQLLRSSLKINYSGNPYLFMPQAEHISSTSNKNKLKVVLGISLSGILTISLALIVGIVVSRKRVSRKKEGASTEGRGLEKELKRFLYQDYSMITVPNPTKSRAFTLDEIIAATQTFTREIGRGGFGSVFFGILPEGKHIAVKVLSLFSRQGVQEFLNEVDLLSKINHKNLVSLLGYCNETREVMLIYEYMSGGSLRDHLYGPRAEESEIRWKTRLKIALDAAQGLEYLHVGSTPRIIHRDVKTANILLDSNFNGKLADFGLSRMTIDGEATHVTTAVKGTAGYLDPEYFSTQMLTDKSDVYSFGVVLLEIICGRPPIDLKLPVEELNITRWVRPYLVGLEGNPGTITEIMDKRLCGGYNMESVTCVAKVALRCVGAEPSSRPSVSEVVAELKEAIRHEDMASISTSEEIRIESGNLLADPVYLGMESSEPIGMAWSANSSNISKVGR